MDGWTDGTERVREKQEREGGWINRLMDGWIWRLMNEWMDGWMDRSIWKDGWIDR